VARKHTGDFGLRPCASDVLWLEHIITHGDVGIPPFERSRLIAMSLVQVVDGVFLATQKGRTLLNSRGADAAASGRPEDL
jgi:hypothetical protein